MFGALPYKTKQLFYLIIKLSIVYGACYFIYHRLRNNEQLDFDVFYQFLIENELFFAKNVLFLTILTIFNWFFEIIKWKQLAGYLKSISVYEAFKQSLASLTAAIFTPGRVGEYAAKILYFPKKFRKRILLMNFFGNATQMSTTILFGVFGIFVLLNNYELDLPLRRISRLAFIPIILGLLLIGSARNNQFKIKGHSLKDIFDYISNLPFQIKASVFVFSMLRYLIFSFQFSVILNILGLEISYLEALIPISSMYLLASLIPSFQITDGIVKGSIALYIFGLLQIPDLIVLSTSLLMWLLNFVLPSIVGIPFVLAFNTKRSN